MNSKRYMTRLEKCLEGARIEMYDAQGGLHLAWFGGHGVHAYNQHGREVSFWNIEAGSMEEIDPAIIKENMITHINEGYYP